MSNDSCKYCKETHCQMEHVKYCKKKKKIQSQIIHAYSLKIHCQIWHIKVKEPTTISIDTCKYVKLRNTNDTNKYFKKRYVVNW